MPRAITSHRYSGEIGTLRIPMEFPSRFFQSGKGYVLHGRHHPPCILGTLWHDYDCPNFATVCTNCHADADVSLHQSVVTALAGAVKKKNHGPFLARRPVVGNVDLVFVINALDVSSTVEKPCLLFVCLSRNRDKQA